MKYLLVVLLMFLASCSNSAQHTQSGNDLIITYDEGGTVSEYAAFYNNLPPTTRVVIDGWCASSCTMALGRSNTCVTPKGYMGFHLAYYLTPGVPDPVDTATLMAAYPDNIKKWIADNGGLTSEIKVLKGDALHALVKSC